MAGAHPDPMPWVPQGPGECGAACLASLLRDRGRCVHIADVWRVLSMRPGPMTLLQLRTAARAFGIAAVGAHAPNVAAAPLTRGSILRARSREHFVVYVGRRRGQVYLLDPAKGPVRVPIRQLHRHVTGHVLLVPRRRGSGRCRR